MTEEEKWDEFRRVNPQAAEMLYGFQLPELEGGPETGKWYRLRANGTVCANGAPYHACFKAGNIKKLLILLSGGGMSVNEYTAARPDDLIHSNAPKPTFYCEDVFMVADIVRIQGIACDALENPFRDWSILVVPYATGDFHCGQNDFPYTALNGEKRILKHHGKLNLDAILQRFRGFVPAPEKLLIAGCSAGGFGVALMSDFIIGCFPACKDVTCCVDGALICNQKWREVAERVWKALCRKLSKQATALITYCWLSESSEAPMLLMKYMKQIFDSKHSITTDFTNPVTLAVTQLGRKVSGERHRILQFIRFQKLADGTYFGIIEPLYNVLSLTIRHFQDRFADQHWIIYDARRHFGYYYDGIQVNEIAFTNVHQPALLTGKVDENLLDREERLYQTLWKNYFHSICIRERLNPVKHKKDMPVRYWKFLTEKN